MTQNEFMRQVERLDSIPKFKSQTFKSALWHYAKDLDESQLAKMISDCLLSGDKDFDFKGAIEAIKRNRASLELTRRATSTSGVCTELGLARALESIGANSLLDAINKARKQNCEVVDIEERNKSGRDGKD